MSFDRLTFLYKVKFEPFMLSQIIPSIKSLTTAVKWTFVGFITGVTAVIHLSDVISGLKSRFQNRPLVPCEVLYSAESSPTA